MLNRVEEVLSRYGLALQPAIRYVEASVKGRSLEEVAEAMERSDRQARRYRKAFQAMSGRERAYVLDALTNRRHRTLFDQFLNSERSEGGGD